MGLQCSEKGETGRNCHYRLDQTLHPGSLQSNCGFAWLILLSSTQLVHNIHTGMEELPLNNRKWNRNRAMDVALEWSPSETSPRCSNSRCGGDNYVWIISKAQPNWTFLLCQLNLKLHLQQFSIILVIPSFPPPVIYHSSSTKAYCWILIYQFNYVN